MYPRSLFYGCLCLLCSLPIFVTAQSVTTTIAFYEMRADQSRGPALSTLRAVSPARYQWERHQFVSPYNEYYLPHRRQMILKLTIIDEQQSRLLPIDKIEMIPAQRFRSLGNDEYLFTPNELAMEEERIGICFMYEGRTYLTKIQLQWQRPTPVTTYDDRPAVITSRPAPTRGYGVQLVALRDAPDLRSYEHFRKYGPVNIVQEGRWYKVQIGAFDRREDAVAAMRKIHHLEGIPKAFVLDYRQATADRPVTYGYDPYGAPRFTPKVGYTIVVGKHAQPPQVYPYGQLAEYDLYYKPVGKVYQVRLGSFRNVEKAAEALSWIRSVYPKATIVWEDAGGTATLLRASSWASTRMDRAAISVR